MKDSIGTYQKVIGYKLLRDDMSLTLQYDRIRYPVGKWVSVPGNGAYVAISGGLLTGGGDVVRDELAQFECEEPSGANAPDGVVCFRKVLRVKLDACDFARLAEHDVDYDVRAAAAAKVEDQALLARLAEHDADWQVREAACLKISRKETKS